MSVASLRIRRGLALIGVVALLPLAGCDEDRPAYRYGPPPGHHDDRYGTDYDAARDYRDEPDYPDRPLGPDDYVYRGSDGRYYCRRSDGTTGLRVGGVGGATLGAILSHGHPAGTLLGGLLGALVGSSIERDNDMRCR